VTEQIDLAAATQAMLEAVRLADDETSLSNPDFATWASRVADFSALCAKKNLKTYIAALGNAMLAKATNPRVDVFSLKANDTSPGAYDARRPAEKVLVPASQRYKFNLGATGPQPLNNQPFFRAYRLDTTVTVRAPARPVLQALLKLLHEVAQLHRDQAVVALGAFVSVRRGFVPMYERAAGKLAVQTVEQLADAVHSLVDDNSEGGKRAQAAAGGIMDAHFGASRVRVGRTNAPDRKAPGDVAILDYTQSTLTRIYEVRDKDVPEHAALAFIAKAAKANARRAAMIAVASDQGGLDRVGLREAARESGIELELFTSWRELLRAVAFASEMSEVAFVEAAAASIRAQLVQQEASVDAVVLWDKLTTQ
jgi:hypothetical protein